MNPAEPSGRSESQKELDPHDPRSYFEFLAGAGARLFASLDPLEAASNLLRLYLDGPADYAVLDLLDESGRAMRIADGSLDHFAPTPRNDGPYEPIPPLFPDEVYARIADLPSQEATVVAGGAEELARLLVRRPEDLADLAARRIERVVAVPLDKDDRRFGVIWLVTGNPYALCTLADLRLVCELADLGATALNNAWLYYDAQEQAQTMSLQLNELRQAMQRIEVRMQRLFAADVIGIIFSTLDGLVIDANDAFLRMVGYTREDLREGRVRWDTMTASEYHERTKIAVDEVRRLGVFTPFEKEYIRKDGGRVPVMVGGARIEGSENNAVTFVIDLTEQRRAERALREREEEHRTLLHAIPDVIFRLTTDGVFLDAMATDERDLPLPRGEFIRKHVSEVLPSEVADGMLDRLRRVVTSNDVEVLEYELMVHGAQRFYEARFALSRAGEALAIVRDITDRKRAERELRGSERRFRAVLENNWDGIWLLDSDGTVLYASPSTLHILGHSPETIVGRSCFEDVHPDDIGTMRDLFGRLLGSPGMRVAFEYRKRHRDGEWRWLEGSCVNLLHDSGVQSLVDNFRDVTEQRHAKEELTSRVRQQAVVSSFGLRALSGVNVDDLMEEAVGQITRVLDIQFCKVLELRSEGNALLIRWGAGWQPGIVGSAIVDVESDSQAAYTLRASEPVVVENMRTETRFAGAPLLRAHGVVSGISVIIHGKDRPFGILGAHSATERRFTSDDIHFLQSMANILGEAVTRKQSEHELQMTKEAAEAANVAKDQFLAVLSHELRTPLTPVLASVEALDIDDELSDDLKHYVEIIRRNVELEARLIDDLLDLTRITKGKLQLNKQVIDLHALVHHVEEICRGDIRGKKLDVRIELDARRHHVYGDPARVQQVLWNLMQNAVKFTPVGGQITVHSSNPSSHSIRIEVTDTGIGIDQEIMSRIFDAFEQGEGTITRRFGGLGLGLAISRMLVNAHGGTLTATSKGLDQGATFTLDLELVESAGERIDDEEEPNPKIERQVVHILLVDDHHDTSLVMKILLERHGYRVTTADCVSKALDLASREQFDLLVSDIGLPDGSGLDLMRALRETCTIKGIALSGFGMEDDLRRSRDAGFHEHLTKPVSFQRLMQAVEELLESDGGR